MRSRRRGAARLARRFALAFALVAAGWGRPASAEPRALSLLETLRAIELELEAAGATVEARASHFLEQGRTVEIATPRSVPRACRALVVLGDRRVRFDVGHGPESSEAATLAAMLAAGTLRARVESERGLVTIVGCGDDASALERAVLQFRSIRGAIEVVVASLDRPVAGLVAAAGREPGPSAPRGDPGPSPSSSPLLERRRRAEERARLDGATNVLALPVAIGGAGRGLLSLRLPAGCHRLVALGDDAATSGKGFDVDVELRVAEGGGELLARDTSESSDARVDVCLGETAEVELLLAGAPPHARVTVLHALWPLEAKLPAWWPARARAGATDALRRRSPGRLEAGPIAQVQGVQGDTTASLEVEPATCYAVVLGIARGAARGARLAVRAGARTWVEESPATRDGAAVSFCTGEHARVELRVEAPSSSASWFAGLVRVGTEVTP
jgi:hypothetical protein